MTDKQIATLNPDLAQLTERLLKSPLARRSVAEISAPEFQDLERIRRLAQWITDPRPICAPEGDDKFAELINIARDFEECNEFLIDRVGVNSSTVWRWATGKSRPSRYIIEKASADIQTLIAAALAPLDVRAA